MIHYADTLWLFSRSLRSRLAVDHFLDLSGNLRIRRIHRNRATILPITVNSLGHGFIIVIMLIEVNALHAAVSILFIINVLFRRLQVLHQEPLHVLLRVAHYEAFLSVLPRH